MNKLVFMANILVKIFCIINANKLTNTTIGFILLETNIDKDIPNAGTKKHLCIH
jgi:hypothetical protein